MQIEGEKKALTLNDYELRDTDINFARIKEEQYECETKLALNDCDIESLVKKGFIYIRYYKDKAEAMKCFNRVLEINENDIDGLLGKCYCILEDKKKHEFDLCQDVLDKCHTQKIKYWRIYYYQSMLYYLRYKDYLSKKALRKALKLKPNHYLSISLHALIQSELVSERSEALKTIQELLEEGEVNFKYDFSVYYRAGKIYEKMKQPEEAISYFQKASSYRQNYSQAMKMVSYVYLTQLNDNQQAEVFALKSIEMDPKNDEAFMNLGEIYEKKNLINEAIEQFKKAIEINPHNETAYLLILDQYEQMGNKQKEFHEVCLNFVKNNPNSADANFEMAFSHSVANDTYSSIRYYKKSLSIETVVDSYNNLGNVYYQQKDLEESEQHFIQALRHDPEDESFNDNLNIVIQNGQFDEDDENENQEIDGELLQQQIEIMNAAFQHEA